MDKINFNYNENASIKIRVEDIVKTCLNNLDDFLKRLLDKNTNSLNIITEKIISQSSKVENFNVTIDSDFQMLTKHPKLLEKSTNMALSLLNYNKYKKHPIEEQIEVDVWDLIRTYSHFEYYYLSSLLEIMPREVAIEYIEKQEAKKVQERRNPGNYADTLQDLIKNLKGIIETFQTQEAVAEVLDGGKMVFKVKKCRWAELMKDLDHEFGFAMLCSTDYEQAKNYNPDFVLTRKNTLMEGNDYCDFCYHDMREENEISHPSKKFWEEFN